MGGPKTVLIVEDHPDVRELLAETLRVEGWTTFTADSTENAIQVAKSVKVHVVLTDILLPPSSGVALEKRFKADPTLAHIPFVFMSGFAPHLDEVGPERSLLKPFETADLCEILAAWTHRTPEPVPN